MISYKVFDEARDYIIENNKGVDNPYHNNKHIFFVFTMSMKLFDIYRQEHDLKSEDRICLGLAALFHDFNHSGGKLKDNENIELAIEGLNDFLLYEDRIDINKIISIIKATEFPHKQMDLNMLQKIIRDADTMGGISDNWFDIVTSLASELKKNLIDFIPIQLGFLNNIKFNTSYCNNLLEDRRDIIKKELLKIQSDLTK